MSTTDSTIATDLRNSLDTLTSTERRVARALLASYPAAGLGSVAELAEAAGTSTASAVRMVQKLGYEGFAEFSVALRRELARRRAGPMDLLDRVASPNDNARPLADLPAALAKLAQTVATSVPETEFGAAVARLADPSRPVTLLGGRTTHPLAEYLNEGLSRLRPGVSLLARDPALRMTMLMDLTRRSTLVAIDLRRYELATVRTVKEASKRRARIVLITDITQSPAANHADIVLPVAVDAPSPFDSPIAVLVVIECLLYATLTALGDKGIERMQDWEQIAGRELVDR